jgi:DNA-binding XRE family transcriptional regulator
MPKIGKKVAKWVDSQTQAAEAIGVSPATIHRVVSGKGKMRMAVFVQMVHFFNPPQSEVDEVWDLYLEDLGIHPGSLRLVKSDGDNHDHQPELSFAQLDSRVNRIVDAVMSSDIDDSAKVKVYNIIQSTKRK